MRAYVIGPVTGIPNDNRDAFEAAREQLDASGAFDVVRIPHDLIPAGTAWEEAMRISIGALVGCDAVAVLDGAGKSRGARLERFVAGELGIECRSLEGWLDPKAPSQQGRQG